MSDLYKLFSGDSKTLSIPLTLDGVAFDPSNSLLIFTAKAAITDADAAAKIQKVSGTGIEISGTNASIALVPQDTLELASQSLCCDIQAQDLTTGEVATVAFFRLRIDRDVTRETTNSINIYTAEPGVPIGPQGAQGPMNVLTVGSVGTGEAGSNTVVRIDAGYGGAGQVISFNIPRGNPGDPNTLSIGSVMTVAAGGSAAATLTGTSPNQTLNLTLPRGNTGVTGATGAACSLSIGTVITGAVGSAAAAAISGAAPNQTLNLTLPTGAQGATTIPATTAKTTPIDTDAVVILDSAASAGVKNVLFSSLWSWIKAKFDAGLVISGQQELSGQSANTANSVMTKGLVTSFGDARYATVVDVSSRVGKPERLWNSMTRLANNRQGSKGQILSTLTIGDSWALDPTPQLRGQFGSLGTLCPPVEAVVSGGASVSAAYSEYSKTPYGNSVSLAANGHAVVFGIAASGVLSSAPFYAARYLTVHHEAVAGGGSYKIQYESATSVWVDLVTVSTDNSGTSTYICYETAPETVGFPTQYGKLITTRIKLVWVSGVVKIYTAGTTQHSQNNPLAGDNRGGVIHASVAYGGSTAVQWDATPQAAWTSMLGWLKTDIAFIRERRETDFALWQAAIQSLVAKLKSARPNIDLVFIGRHPVGTATGGDAGDIQTDDWLRSYCDANGFLFVDLRQFFPSTFTQSQTIGLNRTTDDLHLTANGDIYAKSVIASHLRPLMNWSAEKTDSSVKNGPTWWSGGAQGSFLLLHDRGLEDCDLGTVWGDKGYSSYNPGLSRRYHKRDTSRQSEGISDLYGGQPYAQMDSSSRWYYSGAGSFLTRGLSAIAEINSGWSTNGGLRVGGVTGQSVDIVQICTGASTTTPGAVIAGFNKNGLPFATLPNYVNDAAAGTAGLTTGTFYQTSGIVMVKQ